MAKYSSALTMVMTWTPSGSTVVTTISASARNFALTQSMDSADSTGYGDANHTFVKLISDLEASFDFMLDDTTYTVEDLFVIGASGTLIVAPNGTAAAKKKITIVCFISGRDRNWPYDDVAQASITVKPTTALTEGVYP